MKSKNLLLIIFLMFLFVHTLTFAENIKYFKLDKIVSISGKIVKIRTDLKEHKREFIILELKTSKNEKYIIEVSPKWFYDIDMVKGDIIEIKGSLNIIKKKNIILTQSIMRQGEIYNFRDKLGFPLWRGKGKGDGFGRKSTNMQRRNKGKF